MNESSGNKTGFDGESRFEGLSSEREFAEKVQEKTIYAGFFVDREELYSKAAALREQLAEELGIDTSELARNVKKPHVTTKFAPEVNDLHIDELGSGANITVIGYGNNGINEGFLVRVTAEDPAMQAVIDRVRNPHITLSYSESGHPKDTVGLDFKPLREEDQFNLLGEYCLHLKDDVLIHSRKELE